MEDYQKLYELQDRVLSAVSPLGNDFYLTGGTALHRFYFGRRYSDDLDFFVSRSDHFHEDILEICDSLQERDISIEKEIAVRDFYRIRAAHYLQIDFVNDRVYRHGKSIIVDGAKIDNTINILTNKVNALVSRDEEKDFFDLFCFAFFQEFSWKDILEIANRKGIVEKDILIYRIKTFPLEWLHRIKQIEATVITREHIDLLCRDILEENNNSLFQGVRA